MGLKTVHPLSISPQMGLYGGRFRYTAVLYRVEWSGVEWMASDEANDWLASLLLGLTHPQLILSSSSFIVKKMANRNKQEYVKYNDDQ